MGGLNETIMEAEPLLSLPMGPVRTLGDNRVGWIPNLEDAAPPRCAPVCKATCCAFCAFCAVRYSNSASAHGGTCSACYAFCACYLVCTCCTRCARSTRFQNLTCNTVGHKSAPPARNVQMVAKGIYILWAPNQSQVYIGQTGARDSFRCVFDRGKEHLVNIRDWHLLHKNRRGKVPLYEWIMHVGIQNVVVTPLEKVSTWSADAREIFWMHRFGPANLLNRSIPDLRQEKWSWLMRTKSFAKTHTKTTSATTRITAQATNFIQSRHTSSTQSNWYWTQRNCVPQG